MNTHPDDTNPTETHPAVLCVSPAVHTGRSLNFSGVSRASCLTPPQVVAVFRGKVSTREAEEQMIKCSEQELYILHRADSQQRPLRTVISCHAVLRWQLPSYSTAIQELFKRVSEHFTAMFKRKVFLH